MVEICVIFNPLKVVRIVYEPNVGRSSIISTLEIFSHYQGDLRSNYVSPKLFSQLKCCILFHTECRKNATISLKLTQGNLFILTAKQYTPPGPGRLNIPFL